MSALLKSGSDALRERVRPIGGLRPVPVDPEIERLRDEIATLTAALAARDEGIAALAEEAKAAFDKGEAEGRAAGLREAEGARAATIAAIAAAAEEALARLSDEMLGLESLAVLLAKTCLERMLLDSDERIAIVTDMIRGRVGQVQADAMVAIQVSAKDFDTPEALERLSAALAGSPCEIAASPALASGDCTIALRLGALEVGLGQQWGSLAAALDEMIAPRAAS